MLGLIVDKKHCYKLVAITSCLLSILFNCLQPVAALIFHTRTTANMSSVQPINASHFVQTPHDPTPNTADEKGNTLLFYSLLLLSLLASTFDGSTLTFADSAVLRLTNFHSKSKNVGIQRCFAPFGYAIGSVTSSVLITYLHIPNISSYAGIFLIYLCITCALAITYHFIYKTSVQVDTTGTIDSQMTNAGRDTNAVIISEFKNIRTWFFLLTVLLNGIPTALIYSFTFLYLSELQASTLLFGFANAVDGIVAAIFFTFSKSIVKRIGGTVYGMSLSMAFYAIRLMCTSYIENPLLVLLVNLTNGMTCSLFVFSYIEFIRETYPATIYTFMCGITCSLNNNFGYILANIIGGVLYEKYGGRVLFRAVAVLCAVWSALVFLYGYERMKMKGRDLKVEVTGVPNPSIVT